MQEVKTLREVKEGDEFMTYRDHGFSRRAYISKVKCERTTPKRCVIGGYTYDKETARGIGGDRYHHVPELYQVDESALETGRTYLRANWLGGFDFFKLPPDVIKQVYGIVQRATAQSSSEGEV